MRDRTCPVAVFARAPRPGRVKTRLAATVGRAEAARLYASFIRDTVDPLQRAETFQPVLYAASAEDRDPLAKLSPDLPLRTQQGSHLGQRMTNALAEQTERHGLALLVGTDAPTLPIAHLLCAVRKLETTDVVLGPSADGGYYLIGIRSVVPALDDTIRWSSPHALADTLRCLRSQGRRVGLTPPWYDVDDGDDLALVKLHVSLRPEAAPHTARALLANGIEERKSRENAVG